MHLRLRYIALLCLLPAFALATEKAEKPKQVDLSISAHIFEPASLPPPALNALTVPQGFSIGKVAENLGNARVLVISNGKLYVTRRDEGDILMLDITSDGTVRGKPTRVASRAGLHGLDIHDGKAYIATASEVFVAPVNTDGSFGPLTMIIQNLPAAGQHNNRTLKVGPDNMLYITVGSTCNECKESTPENATILRASLDGKQRIIFASGLRNTIGFDWHPVTGELWGLDHGIDWYGDDVMPEELNLIEKGKRYGWPYVYGNNELNPRLETSGKLDKAEWKEKSIPMVLGYTSHAAPMQMAFYTANQFPEEYYGDAFAAMHGSWNRQQPSGYEIVHIDYENGKPVSIKPFVTGFISKEGKSGRPMGLAITEDGSLLFSDDQNGVIYRVSYKGSTSAKSPQLKAPASAMNAQVAKGADVPLAIQRPETAIKDGKGNTLKVTTPAFEPGGVIPDIYSGYEQDANYRIDWSKGPAATKSYVLIMEDPDSKKPSPVPVVHWITWNIPANVTSLHEGLQKSDRLSDPDGLRQGPTSTGKIGYMGPKPPQGHPEHHYHVQLFALDTKLDLPAGTDRDELLEAMQGHVIASGELVGKFKRPPEPKKP